MDANGFIGHAASGGGIVPNSILSEDINHTSKFFRNLSNKNSNYELNKKLFSIKSISDKSLLEKRHFDFIQLAQKGIYCFDKTDLNNFKDPNYHLVVKPKKHILKFEDLPNKIKNIIIKTRFKGNINCVDHLKVDQFI